MPDVLTNTTIKDIQESKVKDQPIKPTTIEKLFLSSHDGLLSLDDSLDDDGTTEDNQAVVETGREPSISSSKRTFTTIESGSSIMG